MQRNQAGWLGAQDLQTRVLALNREFGGLVHAISRSYAEDPDEANDISQAIWKRVCEILPRKNPAAPMAAWMSSVATRVAMKERHRRVRWESLKRRVIQFSPEVEARDGESLEPSVRDQVRNAVAALSNRQREVVTLRAFEGLSVAEAAARMSCAEGTVKASFHQAVANLGRSLDHLRVAWQSDEIHLSTDVR